jgi:hypothetical protein
VGTMARSDEKYWLLKIGGWAAIVGSLLGMVGNLVHPVTPMHDQEGVAHVIADAAMWVPIHVAIVLGIALMLLGLVAVRSSIQGGIAGALSRFGLVAAISGVTIGLVLVHLDGVGAYQLAQEWAESSTGERSIALGLVHVNETMNFALASLFNLVFAGLTFILFGLAVLLSGVYPRWLGWPAFGAGILSIAAGLAQAAAGEPTEASRILTIIGPTVITLWLLIMGVLVLRLLREAPLQASVAEG